VGCFEVLRTELVPGVLRGSKVILNENQELAGIVSFLNKPQRQNTECATLATKVERGLQRDWKIGKRTKKMALSNKISDFSEFSSSVGPLMGELRARAIKLSGCPSEAEDLLQETVFRAWRFWNNFEAGSNRRSWMYRILNNTFVNRYRRRVREREIFQHVDNPDNADWQELRHEGVGDEVDAALSALPSDYRMVLLRVDLHDESYRDVANELGCPVGTVMSRLHRAREQLKRALRHYADNEGYLPSSPSACA